MTSTMDLGLEALTADPPSGGGLVAGITAVMAAVAGVAAMKITDQSHCDHGLEPEHKAWLRDRYRNKDSFFIETSVMPREWNPDPPAGPGPQWVGDERCFRLTDLECGLHGPIAGDAPVPEDEVRYKIRGNRKNTSRVVSRPKRPTRQVTVIAGPSGDEPCVLYTAFGGPMAPREPGDVTIPNWDGVVESRKFWAEHALTDE